MTNNAKELTLEEKCSMLRAINPTSWNKYTLIEHKDWMVRCYYYKPFITNEYWDVDMDADMDEFTRDERYKKCWFDNEEHYDGVSLVYKARKWAVAY